MSVERCARCEYDGPVAIESVTHSNGTKHIKAACGNCGRFIRWVPRADTEQDKVLLNDPRFREMSRAQLINRIVELEHAKAVR